MSRPKYVIIVAGGEGRRMGAPIPKQFLEIAGVPILRHTAAKFLGYDPDINVIFVLPSSWKEYWKEYCDNNFFIERFTMSSGGITRFHSVKNALDKVPDGALVAVHDGVRPFVPTETIARLFDTAEKEGSAVPVIPLTDSIREISDDPSGKVADRERFVCVQTPQVFRSEVLKAAYGLPYSKSFTDDASVVEAYGEKITLCPGDRENIKITTPFDLKVGEAILGSRPQESPSPIPDGR